MDKKQLFMESHPLEKGIMSLQHPKDALILSVRVKQKLRHIMRKTILNAWSEIGWVLHALWVSEKDIKDS